MTGCIRSMGLCCMTKQGEIRSARIRKKAGRIVCLAVGLVLVSGVPQMPGFTTAAANNLPPSVPLPSAPDSARRVLRLGVYFYEVDAWKDWRRLQRRHGSILHNLNPDVLAVTLRDGRPAFALVADGAELNVLSEACRQLLTEGTTCLVQTMQVPVRTLTAPVPPSPSEPVAVTPVGRERRAEPVPEAAAVPAHGAESRSGNETVPVPVPVSSPESAVPGPLLPPPVVPEIPVLSLSLATEPPAPPVVLAAPETLAPPPKAGPGEGEEVSADEEARPQGRILISLADKRLYFSALDGQVQTFPVAIGRSRDVIVLGETQVVRKRMNPIWRPTPGMRRKDPSLPVKIGPGPRNPMGAFALDLGWQYISIHGTNDPRTIGSAASSGCYRMHASDIKVLFQMVAVGTPVQVVEQSVQRGEISLTRAW